MAFNLRKVLATVLVMLLMFNTLPAGLLIGSGTGTVAWAEALDEMPLGDQAGQDGASDESGVGPDSGSTADESVDPSPSPTPQVSPSTAPDGAGDEGSEPSDPLGDQPEAQPGEQPEEQPTEQPTGQPVMQPDATDDGLAKKAVKVVGSVTLIASGDEDAEPLKTALIPLNAGVSHELKLEAVLSYLVPNAQSGVKWTTSDSKVAKISFSGLQCTVTGLKKGSATITATATDGSGKKAACKVTVATLVESVTVSASKPNAVVGLTLNCTAAITPSNATNKAVTWSSSDSNVATVSSKGVVKGIAKGEATITATAVDGSGKSGSYEINVTPAAAQVTVRSESGSSVIDLNEADKTLKLISTITPGDAAQGVTWASSNAKIAKVDASGVVTGVAVGSATITAAATDGSGKKGTFAVSVKRLADAVTVTGPSKQMIGGKTMTLTAAVTPSNTTNKAVIWTSGKESVATVNTKGVVTAKAVGHPEKVTITATAADGSGVFGTYEINVTPAAAQVTLRSESGSGVIDLNEADKTLKLISTIMPGDAAQGVTWTSSNAKIAKVDASGVVTGVAVGSATITAAATDGSGVKGTFAVTVKWLADAVTVTGPSGQMIGGKTMTLTAAVTPSNTTNKAVTWTSGKESVATVSTKGVVTAKAVERPEKVTITATAADGSGKSGSYEINVTPAAAQVTVRSESGSGVIDLNEADKTLNLTAFITPGDAAQSVTWTSSNAKIAKVDASGVVTGVAVGSATITAAATDGSGVKGTFAVTVTRMADAVTVTGQKLLTEGRSATLTAAVTPTTATNKAVTWTSNKESVATVSAKGVVTAKAVSQRTVVTITATAADGSGKSGSLDITVVPAVEGLAVWADGKKADTVLINLSAAAKTAQFEAVVSPSDAIEGATWKSSNPKVATVNASGLVTGVGAGTATITATSADDSSKTDTCTVSVAYRALSVQVTGADQLVSGETAAMQASVSPASTANKSVLWSVDNQTAASISTTGVLTALTVNKAVSVTVTATAADGSKAFGMKKVTILPRPAAVSIQVGGADQSSATLYLNETVNLQLTAKVSPQDAKQAVTWSTSNASVATVSTGGLVTARAAGSANITATAAGTTVSDAIAITVASRQPTLDLRAITAQSKLVKLGQAIRWTLDAQGDGNITYELTVLKNGQSTDAVPTLSGTTVSYTPAASGAYQLRATAKNQYGNTDTMTGGDSTVCQLLWTPLAGAVELGGSVTSGDFGSFGPDVALPAGVKIEYGLTRKQGTAATLSIAGTVNSVCTVKYAESSLGTAQYSLNYTAKDGSTQLFTGAYDLTCQVVMEGDLPTGVAADPGEYSGDAGTAISIPASDLKLTGGALRTENFVWSLEDAGVPVGQGLTFTTNTPDRYELTLKGVYGTLTLSCPVVITVTKTIRLQDNIRLTEVHPDGDQIQYIGRAWVADGEPGVEYNWTLQRTGGESVSLVIEDSGPGVDFAKIILTGFTAVAEDERNDFTLSCEVNEYYRGEMSFSITNCAGGLTDLPTGITCAPDHYEIAVGGSVTFDATNVQGVGAALPAGAWFDAYNVPWDVCTPTVLEDGFRVTFSQPGRYVIQAAAGYQGYHWASSDVLVTVGDGVGPDFGLTVDQRWDELYLDAGAEGFLADVRVDGARLMGGETVSWSLTTETEADDLPVKLSLAEESDDHAAIFFKNLKAAGEVTYTLTYDAGIYHARRDITVRVAAEAPEGLPTGASYPVGSVALNPGESYTFDRTLVQFTGGMEQPQNPWFDIWPSDSLREATSWDGDECTITFDNAGRYVVKAAAGFSNRAFTYPIEVVVGDAAQALRLDVDHHYNKLFSGATSDGPIARVSLKGFELKDGEECDWSVRRTDSDESNPVSLTIHGDDPAHATVDFHMGEGTGSASFLITAEVGGYSATATIELEVVDYDPLLLPGGLASPYETAYTIPVGGSLTFDPAALDFAEGTMPDGLSAWKRVDLSGGRWDLVEQNSAGGEAVEYTFNQPGRYILTLVVGVLNHVIWRDIPVVVKDAEPLDPGIYYNQRFATIYLGGNEADRLGDANVVDAVVRPGNGEEAEWSIIQTGDEDVAQVTIDPEGNDTGWARILFRMLGGTGTVRYRIRYEALDGLYVGLSEEYTLNVEPALTDLPEEIFIPNDHFTLEPGGTIQLKYQDITYDDEKAAIPDGVAVAREYWTVSGDWGKVDQDWTEEGARLTFREAGYYRVEAALCIGNNILTRKISVLVGESLPLDAGLTLKQRYETAYLGGNEETFLGLVIATGAEYMEGEGDNYAWSITPVTEDARSIADIFFFDGACDFQGAPLKMRLGGEAGEVTYRVDYESLDGMYRGSQLVSLTVEADLPQLPTSITYADPVVTVHPGESWTFETAKISLVGGEIPDGLTPWTDFWFQEGNFDQVSAEWNEDETELMVTFPEGIYGIQAALGVGNYILTYDIQVRAMDGDSLDANLQFFPKYGTVWLDGPNEDYFGSVEARGVTLNGDQDFDWSIEMISGGDVADVYFNEDAKSLHGVPVHYHLKGIPGTVRYKVTYTALGGLYQGACEVGFEVKEGGIEDLPNGIDYQPSNPNLKPGESFTFDLNQITVDGRLPTGDHAIWKDVWTEEGDWGSVGEEWNEDGTRRTRTFTNPGRYLARVVLGVDNYNFTTPVMITVREDGQEALDPGLNKHQRYETVYVDGNERDWLCDIYADGAILTEDERQAAEWNCVQTEGQAVASATFNRMDWNSNGRNMEFMLEGGTGHAQWKITYSAADGLYQGEIYVNLEVADGLTGLPRGITYDGDTDVRVKPGDPVELDLNKIHFTEDGTVPTGAVVWKDFWNEGNWDGIEETWNEQGKIRTNVFPNEGRYLVKLAAGIGNYTYELPLSITVLKDGTTSLDAGLNKHQRSETVYVDGNGHDWLCDIYADGANLTEEERQAAEWNCVQTEGATVASASFSPMDWNSNGRHMEYDLKGVTGHAQWKVTYSAAGGLYQGEIYVDLEVAEPLTNLPEGITYDGVTDIRVKPGDPVELDLNKIRFTGDGTVPAGASVWKDVWKEDGNWDGVEEWWNEDSTALAYTFPNEGRYFVRLAAGIGNYTRTLPLIITVLNDETASLDPGLNKNQRYETAYVDGNAHDWLCDIYADGARLTEDERQAAEWNCVQTEGEDVATASFSPMDWNSNGRHMEYDLKGVTGHARWKVTYSAAGGLYQGEIYVDLEVADSLTGLPGGITYDGDTDIQVQPGASVELDLNKINFTEDGAVPGGMAIWMDIWNEDGNWGGVEENWNEERTLRTNVFQNQGRYFVKLAAGIGNYVYTLPVTVTVLGEGHTALDPDLSVRIRSTTLYAGGPQNFYLGDANVNAVYLSESEKQDVQWTLTPVSGTDIATVTFDNEDDPYSRRLNYALGSGLGSVEYLLSYSSASGVYQASEPIVLNVEETPASMPSGVSYPEASLTVHLGETVSLNLDDIQFVDWTAPEGAPVWKQIWNRDGDWGSVQESWNDEDNVRTNTFQSAGRYTLQMAAGVGNYQFTTPLTITVLPEGEDHLEFSFNNRIRYTRLYLGASEFGCPGDVGVEVASMTDAEAATASYQIEKLSGPDSVVVTLSDNNHTANSRAVVYGTVEGETSEGQAVYRITYSALGGLYRAEETLTFDVVSGTRENLPTTLLLAQDAYSIQPGETVVLDPADIQNANGVLPADASVWREYWNQTGDWGSVRQEWLEGEVRRLTFPQAGTYEVVAVLGIDNAQITRTITITVG